MLPAQKLDPSATEQMFFISCELQQVQEQVQVLGNEKIEMGYEMSGQFKRLIGTRLFPTPILSSHTFGKLW